MWHPHRSVNQGTIYASLVRLQQRGWIAAEWGTSDNNRKAKFYSITRSGPKQLAEGDRNRDGGVLRDLQIDGVASVRNASHRSGYFFEHDPVAAVGGARGRIYTSATSIAD